MRGTDPLAADPLVRALVACLREIAERRAAECRAAVRAATVADEDRRPDPLMEHGR